MASRTWYYDDLRPLLGTQSPYGTGLILLTSPTGSMSDALYRHTYSAMVKNQLFVNLAAGVVPDATMVPRLSYVVLCGGEMDRECENLFTSFMQALFSMGYVGPCYGCCLGVANGNCSKQWRVFDQILVRTRTDVNRLISSGAADPANVSAGADLAWQLELTPASTPPTTALRVIGICVDGEAAFAQQCIRALQPCCNHTYTVLPTSSGTHNALAEVVAPPIIMQAWQSGEMALAAMATKHWDGMLVIGDVHALIMCLRTQTPVFVVYTKGDAIHKLMQDLGSPISCVAFALGSDLDATVALAASNIPGCRSYVNPQLPLTTSLMGTLMHTSKRMMIEQPLVPVAFNPEVALQNALACLPNMVQGSIYASSHVADLLTHMREGVGPQDLARAICFCAIKRLSAPWMGQLTSKMESLTIEQALSWAFDASERLGQEWNLHKCYCPVPRVPIRVKVDLSTLMDQFDSAGLHRSGWAYVMAGLLQLDRPTTQQCDGMLWVDTYMDRTFLWGEKVLLATGVLPYKRNWLGIVHHPWSTSTAGPHSCEHMFASQAFMASLPACKGIIALSQHLADHLRGALDVMGFATVPVHVLRHPIAPCPTSMLFSMQKFMQSRDQWIVQVGTWLRDVYAIYSMPISSGKGCLPVKKAILIGREMQGHVKPTGLFEVLNAACEDACKDSCGDAAMCRGGEGMCRGGEGMSRCHGNGNECMCRLPNGNKYTAGMMKALQCMDASVTVLSWMADDLYDELLSSSVVFMHLTDASAVNVVCECLQRATPLLVNRLPALEELLSPSYPGFYSNLAEAGSMATDFARIQAMHAHLAALPKDNLDMNVFMSAFQDIAVAALL